MPGNFRSLGLLLLGGTLLAPAAIRAGSPPAARPSSQDRDRDRDDRHRVYDRDRHDYHDWDAREERAYRNWLAERNERYRRVEELEHRRQAEYWRWRHSHMDWDGPHRVYDWDRRSWVVWDDREDRVYRRWLAERRENYIAFDVLPRDRQVIYFRWRVDHRD